MDKAIPLGFQHVVVAIVSTVSPALLVANTANMAQIRKSCWFRYPY